MKVKGEGFTSKVGSKEAEQIVSRNSEVFRSFDRGRSPKNYCSCSSRSIA